MEKDETQTEEEIENRETEDEFYKSELEGVKKFFDEIKSSKELAVVAVKGYKMVFDMALRKYRKELENFTCFKCDRASKCEFAFDLYNVNGDCLWSK